MGGEAEALAYFEESLKLTPDDARTLNNYGSALVALERNSEAAKAYERAVVLDPGYAAAWHNLGLCLTTLGTMEQARAALERAVSLAPGQGEYLRSLALTDLFQDAADSRLAPMEAAIAAPEAGERDRVELHFALGKAYADLGRMDESLDHLLAGNALLRPRIRYDEGATLAAFVRIAEAFPAERLAAAVVEPASGPVFIVGMPRSGTTLVEQMLASHPDVHGAGERIDLPRIFAGLDAGFPDAAPAAWRRLRPDHLASLPRLAPDS